MRTATIKTQSWDGIIDFYIGLTKEGGSQMPMLDLVLYIKESKLSARLNAYISVTKLVISIYDPIQPFTEALHIEFETQTNLFAFTYYSKPYEKPTFIRKYTAAQGIPKFNTFLELIRW